MKTPFDNQTLLDYSDSLIKESIQILLDNVVEESNEIRFRVRVLEFKTQYFLKGLEASWKGVKSNNFKHQIELDELSKQQANSVQQIKWLLEELEDNRL